jgi:hypothetical protein
MRKLTVTKSGRIIYLSDEAVEGTKGDSAFIRQVTEQMKNVPFGKFTDDPELGAVERAARAIGATVQVEGELEPIPEDAVR